MHSNQRIGRRSAFQTADTLSLAILSLEQKAPRDSHQDFLPEYLDSWQKRNLDKVRLIPEYIAFL